MEGMMGKLKKGVGYDGRSGKVGGKSDLMGMGEE